MIFLLAGKKPWGNQESMNFDIELVVGSMISTDSGFFVCLYSSPILQRNHRQYQSASYNQPYYNQYQQPNNYQYQQHNDICDGQDKFFNPSVYDMGQNILNGLLGPSSGGAGFGGVTVNTQFQNFGNFNGNFNSGVINGRGGGRVGGIGAPTSNSRFQNFGTFNGNANTGVMTGGNQRINHGGVQSGGFGNQATNGGNQAINMIGTQNKLDIEGRDHRTCFLIKSSVLRAWLPKNLDYSGPAVQATMLTRPNLFEIKARFL